MSNIQEVFSYACEHLNELYGVSSHDFASSLLQCLKGVLNKKKRHEVAIVINDYSGKELKKQFHRFYDNWFSYQFRCFCEDNEYDNRDTIKLFRVYYVGGHFGCPTYLTDKMYGRNERLLTLIQLMEEDDQYHEKEVRRMRQKERYRDDY
jgi:hypothetical protein